MMATHTLVLVFIAEAKSCVSVVYSSPYCVLYAYINTYQRLGRCPVSRDVVTAKKTVVARGKGAGV